MHIGNINTWIIMLYNYDWSNWSSYYKYPILQKEE